ncbi:hypothetical protein K1T71_005635 [Dendrolimus kikuchii]|uniref:Uncharacterized protein n=1 Tax=Dendrolimus kikuchii TaxID=765133 RepID=A0ACC1D4S4_9NEOP|nr:hypothetical protein K1T71_005635 [Dendrolimus kikuchii]
MLGEVHFGMSATDLKNDWNHIKKTYFMLKKQQPGTSQGTRILDGVLDFLDGKNKSLQPGPNQICISEIVSADDAEEITVFVSTNESSTETSTREGELQSEDNDVIEEDPLKNIVKEEKPGADTSEKTINSLLDIDCACTDTKSFFKEVAVFTDQLPVDIQKKLRSDIYDIVLKDISYPDTNN